MAKILKFKLNVILFITVLMPTMWTIYVPEHVHNHRILMDTLELKPEEYNYHKYAINADNKTMQPEQLQQRPESNNEYLLKFSDGQQTLTSAMLANPQVLQRHHTSYDTNDDVVNAYNNANNSNNLTSNTYENLEAQPTSLKEQQLLDNDVVDEMSIIYNDNENYDDSYSHLHSRQRRQLSDFLIAPNTRWCGRGNIANGTYNHLGGATMADKCCRTHDHCKVYIPAMSNRFDLFNYRPYTLSHCNCDRRFRTCLKMASDEDANTIGKLFFNLVQTQCFILIKESVCVERATDGTCAKKHAKQKAYLRNNKKY